ncbi:hypothetical protein PVAG01_10444 [Phlyctema vagabunda]|uniref:Uncharacterized protein n=1 Tax=Phlyctema vagabunda TaxID=108571 RepID=A0ABR4P603_9HELO
MMPNIPTEDGSNYLHDTGISSSGDFLDSTASQHQFSVDSPDASDLDFGHLGDMVELFPHHQIHSSASNIGDMDHRQEENDSTAFLTSIIGNISRQLIELRTQSVESWDPSLIQNALFGKEDTSITCNGSVGLNGWENTIRITTRFLMVLQTMVPAQFSEAPPPFSPPPVSTTLMLLSAYIQLGELFNTILGRIETWLQDGLRNSEPITMNFSVPDTGSFPPPMVRCQIMMMIRVIEHQLQSIERVLGLPSDCRLWDRKDSYVGILGGEKCSFLAQAVMGQAQETFCSVKRTIEGILDSLQLSNITSRIPK